MRRVIFNQKGGVGKSTITCNLAAINAHHGRSTLVVDLDPQSNSSHYILGHTLLDPQVTMHGLYDNILAYNHLNKQQLQKFIHLSPFENLSVLPACGDLELLHTKLESRHKIYKLRDILKQLGEVYDDIYIDTPPALNFFSRSALIAADRCLIPFDCDEFSRRALLTLKENLIEIQQDHHPDLSVEGIIVNQFQSQAKLPKVLVNSLEETELPVIGPYLSSSIKVRESHQAAQPLIYFAPKHKLTEEFLAIYAALYENVESVVMVE